MAPVQRWQLRIAGKIARTVLTAPRPVVDRLAGRPFVCDGLTMDAQSQLSLRLAALAGRDSSVEQPLAESRVELEEMAHALAPTGGELARVEPATLGGVPARIYVPARSPRAALVFMHGGGWTQGSLDSHDAPCRVLAFEAGVVVASLDYRLAPEHPFPAAVDDALAGFRAFATDAARWGVDPERIAIGGDSAGGNLAAVVALETRGERIAPAFQLLIYPAVDLTMSFPSIRTMARGGMLEYPDLIRHSNHYLGDRDRKDPRVSPLFAASHAGLPPAFVATAGFDPLRDEGNAYADRLAAAGVSVRRHCYNSLFHGFINAAGGIRAAREAISDLAHELSAGLTIVDRST